MKIRFGFVTNSSSSSFVIPKIYLSSKQIALIYNHIESSNKIFNIYADKDDEWTIEEDEHEVRGRVFMDNFDMYDYLYLIGVRMDKVQWE
jgi:hypothetical protein